MPKLFQESREIPFHGFSLEFMPNGAGRNPELLNRIKDEVLWIAVRSRGWTDDATLEHFRRSFHIEPLYETNALMLIRREGRLVGLAGAVNDWRFEGCSLIHLCSLSILPEAQGRGLVPAMMAVLWESTLQDAQVREDFENQRAFVTALTQNPYLIGYLHKMFEVYPGPDVRPDDRIRSIARVVAKRFNPHLVMEEDTLILRAECNYYFKKTPYGLDRAINAFCDAQLRYDNGDVFSLVGKVIPARLAPYREQLRTRYAELLPLLERGST